MIILNKYTNVNEYLENILKFQYCLHLLGIRCKKCNCFLYYHGCYEVNHIDNDGDKRIPILRGVCKQCEGNPTHSIKPCFLPGKHQYDLHCREKAITDYENGNCGLKKSLNSAFPGMEVSIMNLRYWLSTARKKAEILTGMVLASVQKTSHKLDVVSQYISKLKAGNYLQNLFNLCKYYIKQIGWKPIDDPSIFKVINTVSNEECTGYYL